MVLLRERARPGPGIIEPCLPSPAKAPHEIKHDGFRILARRDGAGVRLILSRAFADFVESDFDLERVGEYPVRGFNDRIELFAYHG